MNSYFPEFIRLYYTSCLVMLGTCMLGIFSACVGTFVLLRRQSLLCDALSHAALPGIACIFLLTYSKNPAVLVAGGAISGTISILLIKGITARTPLATDTILGIMLAVFFGCGLVIMTEIQKKPISEQAMLNKFIFGNASTLLPADIALIALIGFLVISCIILCWKEFQLITFDAPFARTLGYPVYLFDIVFTLLLILTISIGLQTVGVILMSSMLIAPAAAARQWTQQFKQLIILAGAIGACASMSGTFLSSYLHHVPTGPMIVIVLSSIVFFSLLFSSRYKPT
ncbi:MAG TPA: iron chelate uptake ABC transporter family permease subunit [Candidatus Babeliales bacterium]|nr:iron chelate uptake ABC transporter family permease subunit [Candidatus Babeliales bacterium]